MQYKQINVSIFVPVGYYCNADGDYTCQYKINGSGNSAYCSIFSKHLQGDKQKTKCTECKELQNEK
jgi:hypothetical protein